MRRLIQFELRKIFSRRLTQFFLLALFLVSVLFMFSTYQNKYAFDGVSREGSGREAVEIDKSIAEKALMCFSHLTHQKLTFLIIRCPDINFIGRLIFG